MRLLTIVAQIPRRCPMKRLVDQQADLELDSKGNWEPVWNITEERCNMVVFSPVAQQPSSGIEDRLQAIQEILRRSDQQTVIASACDVTKAATAALAASKGRDFMQPFRRRSWRKQRLTVRATWTFIDWSKPSGNGFSFFAQNIPLKS